MNSKSIIIAVLAASTVGMGVFGWQQYQRASALDSEVSRLTKAARAASERSQRRGSASSVQSTADTPPRDAPAGGRGNWQGRPSDAATRALLESPEAVKLMASQQRGMLDQRYAGLFKTLNLTPAQLAQFKDMLVEKQNATRDVMSVAREQGLDFRANRDEIRELVRQASADIDASITGIIGQDKFAQYQSYEQTQPQRAFASQLEQRLSYTASPLTDAQSTQLVSLLADNSGSSSVRRSRASSRTFGFGGVSASVEITDQVIASAQSFLNASQIDALRQMQSEQNDQRQLQQLMRSNSGGDNADGGNNPDTGARSSRRSRTPRN